MSEPPRPSAVRRRLPVAQINIAVMTAVVFYLYFGIAWSGASIVPGARSDWSGFAAAIAPTGAALLVYAGWFAFQALLERALPARIAEGQPLPDGTRLAYRINGLAAMAVSLAAVLAADAVGWLPLVWLYSNFGAMLSAATIFSFALALFVWWWGSGAIPTAA